MRTMFISITVSCLQAKVGEVYPCHYSIAAMVCLFGAIQSTIVAICVHMDTEHWRLGLNIRLYSSAYAVSNTSSILFYFWIILVVGLVSAFFSV